jgi:hypothetical protein
MAEKKQTQEIIDELIEIEAMCDMLKQKAYNTRKKMEYVSTSSIQKKPTRKVDNDFINNYRISVAKRQSKNNR